MASDCRDFVEVDLLASADTGNTNKPAADFVTSTDVLANCRNNHLELTDSASVGEVESCSVKNSDAALCSDYALPCDAQCENKQIRILSKVEVCSDIDCCQLNSDRLNLQDDSTNCLFNGDHSVSTANHEEMTVITNDRTQIDLCCEKSCANVTYSTECDVLLASLDNYFDGMTDADLLKQYDSLEKRAKELSLAEQTWRAEQKTLYEELERVVAERDGYKAKCYSASTSHETEELLERIRQVGYLVFNEVQLICVIERGLVP